MRQGKVTEAQFQSTRVAIEQMPVTRRRGLLGLLSIGFATFAGASYAATKPDGRLDLKRKVLRDSHGLIELVSYQKMNGVEREFFGSKLYIVLYRAEIVFTYDGFWSGGEDFKMTGNFTAFVPNPQWSRNSYSDADLKEGFKRKMITTPVRKGQHLTVSGSLTYENTDNGWVLQ